MEAVEGPDAHREDTALGPRPAPPTFRDYRHQLVMEDSLTAVLLISVCAGAWMGMDYLTTPGNFWVVAPLYLTQLLTPPMAWWLWRSTFRDVPARVILVADAIWTTALVAHLAFPAPISSAASNSTLIAIKVFLTALFFPWPPRFQVLSATGSVVVYLVVLTTSGHLAAAGGWMHLVLLPLAAALLSVYGAHKMDRNRRALFAQRIQSATSEARLTTLLTAIPDGLAVWVAQRCTFANQRLADLLGYDSPRALIGQDLRAVVAPEHYSAIVTYLDDIAHMPQTTPELETVFLCTDASTVHVSLTAAPVPRHPEPSVQMVVRDITKRKATEAALLASSARYRHIVNDVDALLWEATPQRLFTFVSEGVEALSGYTADDWCHPGFWAQHVHPEDYERIQAHEAQALASGTDYELEYRLLPQVGDPLWVRDITRIAQDEHGTPFLRGLMIDITARQHTERALQEAKDAADAARATMIDFVASTSHDFRTPINTLIEYIEMLRDTDLPPEQQTHLTRMHSATEQLRVLSNDITDFARLEAGHITLSVRPVPLQPFFQELLAPFAADAATQQVELIAPTWHDTTVPAVYDTDPQRLRQILSNLLTNALKFTAHGTITLRISSQDSAMLRFEVADTGDGIPPAKQAHIFQPFAHGNHRYSGTGMGLAICRRLVTALGGDIGVESTTGCGSTFWFTLPRSPATSA